MQVQTLRWRVFDTVAELQSAATAAVLQSANDAIAARGRFLIVLAGGTTPKGIYQQMRDGDTDWSKWHVFFGDERCLPADHADRNSHMAAESLLQHGGIPGDQIHPMPAELGPDEAARCYSAILADIGEFDCVLLGMGEDAHTASLFPGQEWENAAHDPAIAVRNSPKPPSERVSLSASRLSNARQVIFLVTGAGKRSAVQQWRSGDDIPVAAISPPAGAEVYMDAAACPEMPVG